MAFLRRKTIKGHEYYYEVENYWEDGRVRQRVLKYRGPVAPAAVSTGAEEDTTSRAKQPES